MKNRAFSLIEIVVVVAIIGILSGLVGLQLRGYIAKAKDTKAIATLNSFRVAAQLYQLDNEEPLIEDSSKYGDDSEIKKALAKLKPYLDKNAKIIIDKNEIAIGGSKTSPNGNIKYGGKIKLTFKDPNGNDSDGYYMWLEPEKPTEEYDMKGNKWTEY